LDDEKNLADYQKKLKNKKKSEKKSVNKSKKAQIDYIMHYKYENNIFHEKNFKIETIQFNFYKRIDNFAPFYPNSLELNISRENIYIIDNIQKLKDIHTMINKTLTIDFEYSDDTISLIQISNGTSIYLFDYLKLICFSNEFFCVFQNLFKNCIFIAFSMDSSDLRASILFTQIVH